jgi:hypothetical protein
MWTMAALSLVASTAFAQAPTGLQERVLRASAANEPWITGFCEAGQEFSWASSAQVDGIAHPADFVAALRVVWCRADDRPQAQLLMALRQRLPDDASRSSTRVRSRLLAQARDVQTFWYRPYDFGLSVSRDGTTVLVSTSREGGGDEFKWVLARGKWWLVGFSGGEAC